jgi:hypothetical protein
VTNEQDRALQIRYTLFIVNTEILEPAQEARQLNELCDRLKDMGYAQSKRIRIYGEDFEVISNPFPQGKGIAVQAQSKGEKQSRVLQLPLPILQMVSRRRSA